MMQRLCDDICRCHGGGCEVAETCLRYLLHNDASEITAHAASLREGLASDVACPSLIEAEPGKWIRWTGGRQPVSDGTRVQVRFEDRDPKNDTYGVAHEFAWKHLHSSVFNIVAFRVVDLSVPNWRDSVKK